MIEINIKLLKTETRKEEHIFNVRSEEDGFLFGQGFEQNISGFDELHQYIDGLKHLFDELGLSYNVHMIWITETSYYD